MYDVFAEIGFAPYLWLSLATVFFIIEAFSVQLISIWCGLGALVAIIPSVMQKSFYIQFLVFACSSLLFVVLTRPFVKKFLKTKKVYRINADSVIGMEAVVTEEINNLNGCGRVKVDGLEWSARSSDGTVINPGEMVMVNKIEGVKLIVTCKSTITIE